MQENLWWMKYNNFSNNRFNIIDFSFHLRLQYGSARCCHLFCLGLKILVCCSSWIFFINSEILKVVLKCDISWLLRFFFWGSLKFCTWDDHLLYSSSDFTSVWGNTCGGSHPTEEDTKFQIGWETCPQYALTSERWDLNPGLWVSRELALDRVFGQSGTHLKTETWRSDFQVQSSESTSEEKHILAHNHMVGQSTDS